MLDKRQLRELDRYARHLASGRLPFRPDGITFKQARERLLLANAGHYSVIHENRQERERYERHLKDCRERGIAPNGPMGPKGTPGYSLYVG